MIIGTNGNTNRKGSQATGILLLLLTSFIWGSSFVAQSLGMESIDAFTFSAARSVLAVFALLFVLFFREFVLKKSALRKTTGRERKRMLVHGLILGLIFFVSSNLQQFAFYESTAGKIAFLTALYIFFVPLLGLPFGKRIPKAMWLCVVAGFISLYFLCIPAGSGFSLNRGDFLAFLCSVGFSVQILCIERFAKEDDGLVLSFFQLAVSGVLSFLMMFLFETPSLPAILSAKIPLLYAGVLSSAAAYSFQIIGQRYTEATLASLIMCMESVFALACAALVLREYMNGRELFGAALLLCAIVAGTLVSGKESSL